MFMFMSLLESPSYNPSEIASEVCIVWEGTVVKDVSIMCSKTPLEFRSLLFDQSKYHLVLSEWTLLMKLFLLFLGGSGSGWRRV